MHETESPAPRNVVLTRDDAAFLAARLRRLFAHHGYALPEFARDDASLINIAGSCIGAVLTRASIGDTPAPQSTEGGEGPDHG